MPTEQPQLTITGAAQPTAPQPAPAQPAVQESLFTAGAFEQLRGQTSMTLEPDNGR